MTQPPELGATGQKVYEYIRDTMAATGTAPTVREIREAVGVSSIGTVGYWLDKLEAANLIRRGTGENSSIQVQGASPKPPEDLRPQLGATGQKLYDFILNTYAATGVIPTFREMAEGIGAKSLGTVGYWLDRLVALNLVYRDAGKNRSIQLPAVSATLPVPLVGEIRAGSPILAEEWVEDNLVLPHQLVGEGTLFLLRVRGDSMVDAHIIENDLVVVRVQENVQNGDIVAALLVGTEDGATIKRFSRNGDEILLLPANQHHRPIPLGPDGRILGKVVSVLRRI